MRFIKLFSVTIGGFITFVLFILFICFWVSTFKLEEPQQITNKEVEEIYNNLWKYTGLTEEYKPVLKIIKDDAIINAYQDGGEIAIYSGMILFTNNKDQIAGVLGHEIAHFMLEHAFLYAMHVDSTKDYQTVLEGNADRYGAYLVLRAGYNVCEIRNLWYNLREVNGDFELNTDHPNFSFRYWSLDFPLCRGI